MMTNQGRPWPGFRHHVAQLPRFSDKAAFIPMNRHFLRKFHPLFHYY
jgi:hypothetical protein